MPRKDLQDRASRRIRSAVRCRSSFSRPATASACARDLPKVLQPLAGAAAARARARAGRAARARSHSRGLRPRRRAGARGLRATRPRALGASEPAARHRPRAAQAMPAIPDSHQVLVLYGDVPLLRAETLRELIGAPAPTDLALLTARAARSERLRSHRARCRAASCGESSRKRTPARASARSARSIPACWSRRRSAAARTGSAQLKPRNAQGEYYLTDIVALARAAQTARSPPCRRSMPRRCIGVNDRLQLADSRGRVSPPARARAAWHRA